MPDGGGGGQQYLTTVMRILYFAVLKLLLYIKIYKVNKYINHMVISLVIMFKLSIKG